MEIVGIYKLVKQENIHTVFTRKFEDFVQPVYHTYMSVPTERQVHCQKGKLSATVPYNPFIRKTQIRYFNIPLAPSSTPFQWAMDNSDFYQRFIQFNSISLLFVRASRISATISSAERASCHLPTNWATQAPSVSFALSFRIRQR